MKHTEEKFDNVFSIFMNFFTYLKCSFLFFLQNLQFNSCSDQYAWQTLVAYDACIRLCLFAWARGCTEAPEFLRDECLLLRSAFG